MQVYTGSLGGVCAAFALLLLALPLSGCQSCSGDKETKPDNTTPTPSEPAEAEAPPPAAAAAAEAPPAAAAAPAQAKVAYDGPQSANAAGYKITSGFSSAGGEPLTQPKALERNGIYLTVLDSGDHPIGDLDVVDDGEVHGFLVARDMRQAYYARTSGSVAPGADARALSFEPREGGDHALVAVFKPRDAGPQAVPTPVVIRGNLPQIAGPGAAGLMRKVRRSTGEVELSVDPLQPTAGAALSMRLVARDLAGKDKGAIGLRWAVICSAGIGTCEVLQADAEGVLRWTPSQVGSYVVLLPATHAFREEAAKDPALAREAMTFGVGVLPKATGEGGAEPAEAAPAAAEPAPAPAAAPAAP
jgi:hypothetical protein